MKTQTDGNNKRVWRKNYAYMRSFVSFNKSGASPHFFLLLAQQQRCRYRIKITSESILCVAFIDRFNVSKVIMLLCTAPPQYTNCWGTMLSAFLHPSPHLGDIDLVCSRQTAINCTCRTLFFF